MLDFLWPGRASKKAARALYMNAVDQAREPYFYRELGVPDTVDGRFDMISMHVILIMLRLSDDKSGARVNQALFDVMFQDMDRALREMAIGDLSVPKHMKRMMNGFNGRLQHYRQGLSEAEDLTGVLQRNIYGTVEAPDPEVMVRMSAYLRQAHRDLQATETKKILDGRVYYPEL